MKTCTKCHIEKDLSFFSKTKSSKDGLSYSCKQCDNERRKKNREKNIERERAKCREWREKNPDYQKEHIKTYRDRKNLLQRSRRKENPEKYREHKNKWARKNYKNPDKYFVKSSERIKNQAKERYYKSILDKAIIDRSRSIICKKIYNEYPENIECVCYLFMSIVIDNIESNRSEKKKKEREQARKWYLDNRESILERQKKYYISNVSYQVSKSKRNKAKKIERHPSWANNELIDKIYELREFISEVSGDAWHVDHEVPLQGERVSGLHVANNLRIVPAKDNLSKSNSFDNVTFNHAILNEMNAGIRVIS